MSDEQSDAQAAVDAAKTAEADAETVENDVAADPVAPTVTGGTLTLTLSDGTGLSFSVNPTAS